MARNTAECGKRETKISRRAPKPPYWESEPGICRGCGAELLTDKGEKHKGRRWCPECREGWRIAGHPTRARAAVFMRDFGICNDCGEDCTSYEVRDAEVFGTYTVQINRWRAFDWCKRMLSKAENPKNPQSEHAIDLGEWHVDHAMPLHLVDREKPDAWLEWTLPNLRTRCPSCHDRKTAAEAKARGKVRRLSGTTKKKPSRKIPQRANPWGKKPKEESQVVIPDKPWLTEAQRDNAIIEQAAARQLNREMQQINDRRAAIQAAHKNLTQRKREPNKLQSKGFRK